jgi:hypothetical protein
VPGTHTQCSILIVATVTVEYAVTPKLIAAVMNRALGGSRVAALVVVGAALRGAVDTLLALIAAVMDQALGGSRVAALVVVGAALRGAVDTLLAPSARDGPSQGPATLPYVLPSRPTWRLRSLDGACTWWEQLRSHRDTRTSTTRTRPTPSCRPTSRPTLPSLVRLPVAHRPGESLVEGACIRSRDSTTSAT